MTAPPTSAFYGFKPLDKTGTPFDLSSLQGKVVLVVNTASKCGFTPQYESLERLYQDVKKSHPAGSDFTILGFPCNQFGGQEPGSNGEIQQFCTVKYGVTFPVLGKVDVNGENANPLWEWLKKEKPGLLGIQRVKWNFEKFLVGKDGTVKGRWASTTKPESLKEKIEEELGKAI
ncbi:thioredoxin-like protein [Tirmania nivea]|nr:thioredoxin-like protein [Tirmania nivea]